MLVEQEETPLGVSVASSLSALLSVFSPFGVLLSETFSRSELGRGRDIVCGVGVRAHRQTDLRVLHSHNMRMWAYFLGFLGRKEQDTLIGVGTLVTAPPCTPRMQMFWWDPPHSYLLRPGVWRGLPGCLV